MAKLFPSCPEVPEGIVARVRGDISSVHVRYFEVPVLDAGGVLQNSRVRITAGVNEVCESPTMTPQCIMACV